MCVHVGGVGVRVRVGFRSVRSFFIGLAFGKLRHLVYSRPLGSEKCSGGRSESLTMIF